MSKERGLKIRCKRIGESYMQKCGCVCTIIDVVADSRDRFVIKWEDDVGHIQTAKLSHIKSGSVLNPFAPKVFGVAYFGVGEYSQKKDSKAYGVWYAMLERSYCPVYHEWKPSYKGCYVCAEWLNFQNFASWYYDNLPPESGEVRYQLDKDILYAGNKEYSPERCVFVPDFINSAFKSAPVKSGSLPRGVVFVKGKYYTSQLRDRISHGEDSKYLGIFNNKEDAHKAWQVAKLEVLKDRLEMYLSTDHVDARVVEAIEQRIALLEEDIEEGKETFHV